MQYQTANVCHKCIHDIFVIKKIKREGKVKKCRYCESKKKCISINDLAEYVDQYIKNNYDPAKKEAYFVDNSGNFSEEQDGEPIELILVNILDCHISIALDIAKALESNESYRTIKNGNSFYYDNLFIEKRIDTNDLQESWLLFCHEVKHSTRFSISRNKTLDNIFSDLEKYKTYIGASLIKEIRPQDSDAIFFRARWSDKKEEIIDILLNPESKLGPPPVQIVKPGRMNPAGISVFYGAYDVETCIAEVRPPVGSWAITGKFVLLRQIQVLDLTLLDQYFTDMSVFDPEYQHKSAHMQFLRELHHEISKPISTNNCELEYIPTQVIAEYLANHNGIDGIIYSSSQTGEDGKNIVIFNKTCKVKQHKRSEIQPRPYFIENEDNCTVLINHIEIDDECDDTQYSLELTRDSIRVHRVEAAKMEYATKYIFIQDSKKNTIQ